MNPLNEGSIKGGVVNQTNKPSVRPIGLPPAPTVSFKISIPDTSMERIREKMDGVIKREMKKALDRTLASPNRDQLTKAMKETEAASEAMKRAFARLTNAVRCMDRIASRINKKINKDNN